MRQNAGMANEATLPTKDVAALYRFDVETVRRWVRMGRLRAMRVGSQMRFSPRDVADAMNRGGTVGSERRGGGSRSPRPASRHP